jgi:hypothetical protein
MARTWSYPLSVVVMLGVLVTTGVLIWVQVDHPILPASVPPTAVVWGNRTFVATPALRSWLRSRGVEYKPWARRHKAAVAALEHRPLPPSNHPQPTGTPGGLRRRHLSSFSGLWLIGCLALGAALLSREDRPHPSRLIPKRRRQIADWIEHAHPKDSTHATTPATHGQQAPKRVEASEPVSPELVLVSHLRAAEIAALPDPVPAGASVPPSLRPDAEDEVPPPPAATTNGTARARRPKR